MKPQNKKRFRAAVLLLILLFVLSACSRGQSESSPPESSPPVSTEQEETAQPETEQPETPDVAANEAVLYIGTRDGGFTEYPMTYEGTLTPEILIAGIADLTGWDMTLAENVTTGKALRTVPHSLTGRLTRRTKNSLCSMRSSLHRPFWTAPKRRCKWDLPARAVTRTRWIFTTTWRARSRWNCRTSAGNGRWISPMRGKT